MTSIVLIHNYMKRKLLLIYVLFIACIAGAVPRSQEDAMAVARNFFAKESAPHIITRSSSDIHLVATSSEWSSEPIVRSAPSQPAFYIYNKGEEAFVIVSGDDRMPEILGYSDNGAFVTENLPDNIKNWLGNYIEAYRTLDANNVRKTIVRRETENGFAASVAPLLQDIQYNQDTPYNDQCPLYQGERCLTGCVATAAAQILRYWKYPAAGTGSINYTTDFFGLQVSFDFDAHPFDWNNILPAYSGEETKKEIEAVSTLMLACGAVCRMNYTPNFSSAYDNDLCQGLINYLGYDTNMYYTYKSYYTPEEWMAMIKTELNEKRPIYYSGSSTDGGHAFVIDGYDTHDMVHVNWGWGGYCNGYFELLRLDAEGTGLGGYDDSRYQFLQGMIIGIQPQKEDFEYISRFYTYGYTFSKKEITTESMFTVTINGIYNMVSRFEGALGLVMEKDGIQTPLAQRSLTYNNNYGSSNLQMSAKFPSTLEDGTYDLYIASKANNEQKWNKAYGDLMDNTAYKMVKEGNKCTLHSMGFDFNALEGSLTQEHTLYTGHEAGLILKAKNTSDSQTFFGNLGVYIMDEDGWFYIDTMDGSMESLQPGEEITIKLNNIVNVDAGTYYIYPVATTHSYNTFGDGQLMIVKQASPGNPTLNIDNCRLESDIVENGNALNILATLSLKGKGDVNTTWLYHSYTRKGEDEPAGSAWDTPFIEMGNTLDYHYTMPVNTVPGEYVYRLYARHPTSYITKVVFEAPFTVKNGTGIQDAVKDKHTPYLYAMTENDELQIRNAIGIENIAIYGMSGQLIRQFRPEVTGDGDITIPVNRLDKGSYIMLLLGKNACRHTIKFIR